MARHKATSPLHSARQMLYRFTALAFLDPQIENWSRLASTGGMSSNEPENVNGTRRSEPGGRRHKPPVLADRQVQQTVSAAAEYCRNESAAVPVSWGIGERSLSDLDLTELFRRLPRSPDEWNAEFEQTFGLVSAGICPPYETEYLPSKFTFQRSHHMADAAGFYRAFGLDLSRENPERPDHITLELEFMACLIGLERYAAASPQAETLVSETDQDERIRTCRQAQRRFLREHLAWWVPTFARLLELENPDGFYAAAGRFLSAFLPAERALLGVESVSQGAAPSRIEAPEQCTGCLMVHGTEEFAPDR